MGVSGSVGKGAPISWPDTDGYRPLNVRVIETWLKSSEGQLAILGILMAAGLHLAGDAWWVDVLSSFRAHLGIAVLVGMVVAMVRKRWSVAVVDLLLAGFLLAPLSFPRTPTVSGIPDLRIAVHNVHTANRDFESVLADLEASAPDVMAIIEVDDGWEDAIRRRFPNRHILAAPRSDNFGIALVSRRAFTGEGLWETPPIGASSIDVVFNTPNGPIRLIVTHPVPPLSKDWWRARNTQLEAVIARAASSEIPVVVAGDLNLSPTSPAWSRIIGGSPLRRAGLPLGTWPSWLGLVGLPIDHVLTSPGLAEVGVTMLPGAGSDHRGLLVDLRRTAIIIDAENP
ncbi:MAG: endonuclease/exonuclease/phosphatase (EEP) superfamily protein YafD [Myxococcota bacterium]|jgi:endonuclease/exonuclease/phosphatase (EEP) superfamily protein YafD